MRQLENYPPAAYPKSVAGAESPGKLAENIDQ
jgi:hypothetical protein